MIVTSSDIDIEEDTEDGEYFQTLVFKGSL